MRKNTCIFLLAAACTIFAFRVQILEGQSEHSHLLGLWEIQWDGPLLTWELIVKEVLPNENKAKIILKHPNLELGGAKVAAQVLDIDHAVFKQGEPSEIVYKAHSGNEYFFKFNQDGSGMSKLLRVGGGPNSIWYGEIKKK